MTLAMMRHDPTPVPMRTAAPARHASADVSPIDPGIHPVNACHGLTVPVTPASPSSVASASTVAPLTPSGAVPAAIQMASPDISAG